MLEIKRKCQRVEKKKKAATMIQSKNLYYFKKLKMSLISSVNIKKIEGIKMWFARA